MCRKKRKPHIFPPSQFQEEIDKIELRPWEEVWAEIEPRIEAIKKEREEEKKKKWKLKWKRKSKI